MLSLVATDALPSPREALAYYDAPARMADIPLPPPPRTRPPAAAEPTAPAVSPNATPIVAPDGIAPETGIENAGSTTPDIGGGVVVGAGSDQAGSLRLEEPPPPPPPDQPVRLHSGIRAPEQVVDAAPVYPAIALAAHVQGLVILETTIDVDGRVADVRILRSIPSLDAAALAAVRQWRFTPALLNACRFPSS